MTWKELVEKLESFSSDCAGEASGIRAWFFAEAGGELNEEVPPNIAFKADIAVKALMDLMYETAMGLPPSRLTPRNVNEI